MSPTTHAGALEPPRLGLGALRTSDSEARKLVERALAVGYRHVDTGQYYGNEHAVGQAVAAANLPREDIWITTKFLHPKSPPPDDLYAAAGTSLRRLGVDYVDAMMIHWPHPDVPLPAALDALSRLREHGVARTVGVCNFPVGLLREALDLYPDLDIVQAEYHPYLDQRALLAVVREHELPLIAHSPLARGSVLRDEVVVEIASSRERSPAQVVLRWLVQQDRVGVIPGTSPEHPDHLSQDVAIFDFELTDGEMDRISSLARGTRVVDPPHAPAWDG